MNEFLKNDIKYIKGCGDMRAELLKKQLNVHSFGDLLYYFPFRYIDRSKIYRICDLMGELPYIQLKGRFFNMTIQGEGRRKRLTALFNDGTGNIECVWFNSIHTISEMIRPNQEYLIFGKPTIYKGTYNITHPDMDPVKPTEEPTGMIGVYTLTETLRKRGFSMKTLRNLIYNLLPSLERMQETLPDHIIREHNLMRIRDALRNIHRPDNIESLNKAQERLKFEELFYLQLNIQRYTRRRNEQLQGFRFTEVGVPFHDFYANHMPFPLTNAQKRVIKEVRNNMNTGKQMNRLVQGDVGSGKTLVAFLCMLIACGNGYQSCLMAPTEILATQHAETLRELGEKIGVRVELLTGSTRAKKRREIHEGLLDGSIKILIGTHAVIEDNVQFAKLGFVVIDEQHRFGVAQRAKLWKKNIIPPHVLVMTATPIPRTLAMTVYGDLDVSIIDELPPGRKPVDTYLRYDTDRNNVLQFIGWQLKQGRQAYIVYPLVHESEKLDLKNLEEGYEYIREKFPHYNVCFVHGQMKPAEKDYQMGLFVNHEADIMVATTVIEVGVNVPNASVMVIENAERFGLSQLHQLRGRVGRGADKAYCILMSKPNIATDTRKRLELMTRTTDGFEIAEEDMKMRGPGDMEGTQQSGIALDLKISNLAKDGLIIQQTRDAALKLLNEDPDLTATHNAVIPTMLHELFDHKQDWSLIS